MKFNPQHYHKLSKKEKKNLMKKNYENKTLPRSNSMHHAGTMLSRVSQVYFGKSRNKTATFLLTSGVFSALVFPQNKAKSFASFHPSSFVGAHEQPICSAHAVVRVAENDRKKRQRRDRETIEFSRARLGFSEQEER